MAIKIAIKKVNTKQQVAKIKCGLKASSKRFMWQLGYKPLKEPKDEDFKTLFKKTIRTRKSREIEAEIENIMFECKLFNASGEYAMHLNTSKKSDNHYATYWKVPRGKKINEYIDKIQIFEDGLIAQVLIEERNGCMCIEVWEGIIPTTKKGIPYDFKYLDYIDKYILPVPVGESRMGLYVWDLTKIIHCMISGSTGGGKSILLTGWVDALLQNPNVLLFIIDLAMTDFAYTKNHVVFGYDIHTAEKIINYIKEEAEKRRRILVEFGNVNIIRFNKKFPEHKIPYLILIIDEFAFTSPGGKHLAKEEKQRRQAIQGKIAEIAQISRKLGIHLIISTQKPSKQLFPEEITTHFPGRVSFKTNDRGTSMTILGNTKAYYLPNQPGRMIAQWGNKQVEAQALYLDPDEAERRMKMFDKYGQYEKGDSVNDTSEQEYGQRYQILQHQKKRLLPRSSSKKEY